MFIGEIICLPIFLFLKYRKTKQYGSAKLTPSAVNAQLMGLRLDVNVCWFIIPCVFDIVASTLMFVGLTMIAASVYQMLRGMIVFVATIMSIIFLGKKYYRHHWTALSIVVIGVAIVGASPIMYPDKEDEGASSSNPVIGLILVLAGQVFSGFTMVSEEKLFRVFYIHPLQMVGWEGVWGLIFYSIILIILQFIPCPSHTICTYDTIEDTRQAFYEFSLDPLTWILGIGSILSISLYNSTNVAVTKFASCVQKATINTSKPALVWIFWLFYPGKGKERFIWPQIIGFTMIVFGTLMYNEIFKIPFFGLNEYTEDKLTPHNVLLEEKSVNMSPDASHNLKRGSLHVKDNKREESDDISPLRTSNTFITSDKENKIDFGEDTY
uniref:Uncharacterized protein n=1 Tax=Euplotes crassus TaxID=5936 RepID=A0A7S3NYI0_EUPCR|mmetsp:Transcript_7247/g.6763  ORF Transcript_7247/g.6763 Transcript_7247/m.6763 type:complete len:381 (+) Transcript_7247:163-1305(+)